MWLPNREGFSGMVQGAVTTVRIALSGTRPKGSLNVPPLDYLAWEAP